MSKSHKQILARTDAGDLQLQAAEIIRLRTVIQRVIGWIDSLAAQSEAQEKQNRGRFNSLADACAADAKNYRATANNLRRELSE